MCEKLVIRDKHVERIKPTERKTEVVVDKFVHHVAPTKMTTDVIEDEPTEWLETSDGYVVIHYG